MVYLVIFLVFVAAAASFIVGWYLNASRGQQVGGTQPQIEAALGEAVNVLRRERADSMQAALDQALSVASTKLGEQLAVGKMVIDRDRGEISNQVESVTGELHRVATLVADLQKERAAQSGQIAQRLESAAASTAQLATTTEALQRALASPTSRGQWGERMAQDVLTAAGFVEGISYFKQQKLAGGTIPDFSFPLPKGHYVHMDVKFPIENYLRWLSAENDADRAQSAKGFRRDVRLRLKEVTERDYVDPEHTVDYVLLFVPNESVYGFLHEHDPKLIDTAMAKKVVLCSPTTLFAVLAVIRQAVDSFLVERRSGEILSAVASLREQWDRWDEPMGKMKRGLQSAQNAFDELSGPRSRVFEKHLQALETVRDTRRVESGTTSRIERSDRGTTAEPLTITNPSGEHLATASLSPEHNADQHETEFADHDERRRSKPGQYSITIGSRHR